MNAATKPAVLTDAERQMGLNLDLVLGRLLRWNRRNSEIPFGPGMLSALGTVVDASALRLGDLAAREGVTPASLTRTVAILEGKALLARTVDPADRRSFFVEATGAGVSLIEDQRRQRGEGLARRLAPLTAAHLAVMSEIVRAINELAGSPDANG